MPIYTVVTQFGTIVLNRYAIVSSSIKRDGTTDGAIALDVIESVILGHHRAGIDVTGEDYIEGINTALEALDNNS